MSTPGPAAEAAPEPIRTITLKIMSTAESPSDISVQTALNITVAQLKLLLKDALATRPEPACQRLIFRGRQLVDTAILKDVFQVLADPSENIVLHMVINTGVNGSTSTPADAPRRAQPVPQQPATNFPQANIQAAQAQIRQNAHMEAHRRAQQMHLQHVQQLIRNGGVGIPPQLFAQNPFARPVNTPINANGGGQPSAPSSTPADTLPTASPTPAIPQPQPQPQLNAVPNLFSQPVPRPPSIPPAPNGSTTSVTVVETMTQTADGRWQHERRETRIMPSSAGPNGIPPAPPAATSSLPPPSSAAAPIYPLNYIDLDEISRLVSQMTPNGQTEGTRTLLSHLRPRNLQDARPQPPQSSHTTARPAQSLANQQYFLLTGPQGPSAILLGPAPPQPPSLIPSYTPYLPQMMPGPPYPPHWGADGLPQLPTPFPMRQANTAQAPRPPQPPNELLAQLRAQNLNNPWIPQAQPQRPPAPAAPAAAPPAVPGRPAMNANEIAARLHQIADHLGLLLRLGVAIMLFTGGPDWTRNAVVWGLAIVIFIYQTGVLNPYMAPVMAFFNNLLPDANPAPRNPAAAGPNGIPEPREVAARLIRQQNERQMGVVWGLLDTIRRAVMLFAASLIPGLGERMGNVQRARMEAEAAGAAPEQVEEAAEAAAEEPVVDDLQQAVPAGEADVIDVVGGF